jgi:fumarate reductase subunit C
MHGICGCVIWSDVYPSITLLFSLQQADEEAPMEPGTAEAGTTVRFAPLLLALKSCLFSAVLWFHKSPQWLTIPIAQDQRLETHCITRSVRVLWQPKTVLGADAPLASGHAEWQ